MKTLSLKLMLLLIFAGCLRTKPQQSISPKVSASALENIHHACEEIKSTGDLVKLLTLIDKDMQNLMHVLNRENLGAPEEHEATELADEIQKNSALVKKLSQENWSNPEVGNEINWEISNADFPLLPGEVRITDAKVHKIYFMGEEREDLLSKVTIDPTANRLKVSFEQDATILEFCQLNKTLMVVVEVKYRNLWKTRSKFFGLNVRHKDEL